MTKINMDYKICIAVKLEGKLLMNFLKKQFEVWVKKHIFAVNKNNT